MFKPELKNEVISLGAIYQASSEIKKIAWEGKINNKIMSINSKTNKFSSVRGINPSFINVRNVKIPRKIQVKEDKMIQLKFLIILNM